jgi:hypothetical protein
MNMNVDMRIQLLTTNSTNILTTNLHEFTRMWTM